MSFSRAQRFNYKKPDSDVSPADYNVSTCPLDKGVLMSKCPRFREKAETGKFPVCHRMNCCKRHNEPLQSFQSDSSDTSREDRGHEKSSNLPRNDFSRSSVRRKSIMKKTSTPKPVSSSKPRNKHTYVSFNSSSKDNHFLDNEEFIDDDYHSYTSSEELDSLKKVEEYEFNEVCTAYALLVEKHKTSKFENSMMQKLNDIEGTLDEMKTDFVKLSKTAQVQQLQKHHETEKNKMENVKRYFEEDLYNFPQTKYQEVLKIIANAVSNLNKEFEHKRRKILKRSESRILELIDDIYDVSNSSAKEINHLCNETAVSVSKRLMDVMRTPSFSDLSLTHHCDSLIERVQDSVSENHECFNYENICKLLSDKLQVTQDELEALEEDNLDITLKFHDTQQALEAQSSVIDVLHTELAKLKESIQSNDK